MGDAYCVCAPIKRLENRSTCTWRNGQRLWFDIFWNLRNHWVWSWVGFELTTFWSLGKPLKTSCLEPGKDKDSCLPKHSVFVHTEVVHIINTYTAKPVCWNGWISDSYCSIKPLCLGMGEVVPARTSPTLLPPSPRTVLSLSCFKVSQCINCRDWHCKS